MKILYMVPIIHMSADMGSAAPALERSGAREVGQELWQRHKETISGFWDAIALFFDPLDTSDYKIYQDGLVADGQEGLNIVEQAASSGSKNYDIIKSMLRKGAVLVQTEDLSLVKLESNYISKIINARSPREKELAAVRYRQASASLLTRRDSFVAKRIAQTLGQGETGVLFIGAYHNVIDLLAPDIRVLQVKKIVLMKKYHKLLLQGERQEKYFRELEDYLTAPVHEID